MEKKLKQEEKVEVKKEEIQAEQISREKSRQERTASEVYQVNGKTLIRLKGLWTCLD